jgi:hypothetical protein
MRPVAATADKDKQLAWEARQRPRAGFAAVAGALGLVLFFVLQEILARGVPDTSLIASLQRAVQPGRLDKAPSLQVPIFEYLHDHAALVFGVGASGLIGYLGMAWAVAFLAVATHARNPSLPRWAVFLPIAGGGLMGLSVLVFQIGRNQRFSGFLSSHRTVADALAPDGTLITFAKVLGLFGSLTLAAGIVLIALNAMRAGLLTRFYGVLGIITGAMLVLLPLPIIQIFWLGALAMMFVGLWPGGLPPAWSAGEAIAWPGGRPRRAPVAPAPPPEPRAPATKRKRKKRT